MGIASDLNAIKTITTGLVQNKLSRFSYTETAYTNNDVNGVSTYDVNNEQNIPLGTPSVMKVNDTVVDKGYRARASSLTRMLLNHFFGRTSYNLNKVVDMLDTLISKISLSLGQADGFAMLDSQGKVALLNNVENTGDSDTPVANGTTKFTTGGAYALYQSIINDSINDKTSSPTQNSTKNFTAGGAYTLYQSIINDSINDKTSSPTQNSTKNFTAGGAYDFFANCTNKEDWLGKVFGWALGKNWTQGTGGTSYIFRSMYYANGIWVAGSDNGLWWSSFDNADIR